MIGDRIAKTPDDLHRQPGQMTLPGIIPSPIIFWEFCMRLNTFLLTSAAALVAATGAQAADLPSRKAAPVEYVRVCSTYGAGFFYIPGTDTCIRVGGRARFEWQYAQPYSRGDNVTGSRAI